MQHMVVPLGAKLCAAARRTTAQQFPSLFHRECAACLLRRDERRACRSWDAIHDTSSIGPYNMRHVQIQTACRRT